MTRAKNAPLVVLVANAISDGKGGYLPKGEEVKADAATLASLKAKGLIG